MPISCAPADLAEAAKCFCFDAATSRAVQTYLLCLAAGVTPDPNALALAAREFMGLSEQQHMQIQDYLLCQVLK